MRNVSSNRPRAQRGFSMIEAMVVVSIIGIMTAAAAPAMSEMMVDGRQTAAAQQLVGIGRNARDAARETGFAHRLDFAASGSSGLGSISMQVAMTGSCIRSAGWVASGGVLRMSEYSPALAAGRTRLILTAMHPNGGVFSTADTESICFEPDGESYTWTTGDTQFSRQAASVLFLIRRQINGAFSAADPVQRREIVFPPGGAARTR